MGHFAKHLVSAIISNMDIKGKRILKNKIGLRDIKMQF